MSALPLGHNGVLASCPHQGIGEKPLTHASGMVEPKQSFTPSQKLKANYYWQSEPMRWIYLYQRHTNRSCSQKYIEASGCKDWKNHLIFPPQNKTEVTQQISARAKDETQSRRLSANLTLSPSNSPQLLGRAGVSVVLPCLPQPHLPSFSRLRDFLAFLNISLWYFCLWCFGFPTYLVNSSLSCTTQFRCTFLSEGPLTPR
jgi:hypothetical protein